MYCNLKCKTLFLSVCLLLMNSIATAQDIETLRSKTICANYLAGLVSTTLPPVPATATAFPCPVFCQPQSQSEYLWDKHSGDSHPNQWKSQPAIRSISLVSSPHYKWITLSWAGYRQYSYSPFTVSGQDFVWVEAWCKLQETTAWIFGGRLCKAVQVDWPWCSAKDIPEFIRWNISTEKRINSYLFGSHLFAHWFGWKIGFGTLHQFCGLVIQRIRQREKSQHPDLDNRDLKPEENVVLGVNIFQRFLKHFTFGFNGAASIYTHWHEWRIAKSDFLNTSVWLIKSYL